MKPNRNPLILGAATLLLAQPALAEDPLVGNNPAQRSVEAFQPTTSAGQWTLGLGAAYAPRYEGSNEHVVGALPVVAYQRGRFAAGAAGLPYNLSPNDAFQFGPRLSLRGGRDENDADRLSAVLCDAARGQCSAKAEVS